MKNEIVISYNKKIKLFGFVVVLNFLININIFLDEIVIC